MAHEILVIDDEADIRMLMCGILKDEGYETREAGSSNEALAAVRSRQPTLVILDIWLQGSELDGLEILKIIRRELPNLPVVMISGHGTIETAVAAIKIGAYDFIEKPFKADRLLLLVERAIEAARLRRENEELRLRAGGDEDLIGTSSAVSQLRSQIERVAPTGSRVLITGAPGVRQGSGGAARCISVRAAQKGPFVVLSCATMRPDRLEIELFGADAGSDAGRQPAQGRHVRAGAWRHALPRRGRATCRSRPRARSSARLQEQTFERVGGGRVKVDVRVIASTNRDLALEIAAGRFREDLYYRLAVVPVHVPRLKERRRGHPGAGAAFHAARRRGRAPHAARVRRGRARRAPGL